MRFTVTCSDELHQKLARLWLEASNRATLSRASNRIDQILRASPAQGMDLGSFYMLTVGPLTVVYVIFLDDCTVTIQDYLMDE